MLDAHGGKDDGELGLRLAQRRLPCDLGGQRVVRHAAARKDGQLLPADERVHAIDGRDTCHDQVARVGATRGVDGGPVDVAHGFGNWWRHAVDRLAEAAEHAPQHVDTHWHGEGAPDKAHPRRARLDAGGAGPYLHDGALASHFEDVPAPPLAIRQ